MSRSNLRRKLRYESLESRDLLASYAYDQMESVSHNETLHSSVYGYSDDGVMIYGVDTGPSSGSVTLNSVAGVYQYTPDSGFVGVDSFVYSVNAEAMATVTINVTNQAPVAYDSPATVIHNQTLTGAVSGYDPDGDTLTYVLQAGPYAGGSLALNSVTGAYAYTPLAGFVGTDTFTFGASDGFETSAGTVTINVTNTTPIANGGVTTVPYDTLTSAGAGGYDSEGDSLTFQLVDGPANAEVFSFNADGSFEYLPSWGWVGEESFTFTVAATPADLP